MEGILHFIFALILAIIGGLLGDRIKLPAGGMLGAMAAVIVYNLVVQPPIILPGGMIAGLQLFSGTMIGSRISKKDMLGLKKLAYPAIVMLVTLFVLNISFGFGMYRLSKLDIPTALFATAPGGMMDMAIISDDLGANAAYVAILQLSRIMFILICMMPFYRKIMSKLVQPKEKTNQPTAIEGKPKPHIKWFFVTFAFCAVVGLTLRFFGVPAGAIMGAMLGGAIFNIFANKGYFPTNFRLPLQIVAGTFIGLRMDRASIFAMNEIIIPVLILFVCVVVMTTVTAFAMHKLAKLDLFTCILAATPGGLTEMALMADDLGADAPKVAVLHMARLICVIIFFPIMLAVVIGMIG